MSTNDSDKHEEDEEASGHGGRHEEHEEGGHGEPWLISYADMMTLLFGFFVIMYAFAAAKNVDDTNMIKVRRELAVYFGGKYVNPTDKMKDNLEKLLESTPELQKNVEITTDGDGIKITITSQVLFERGKASFSPTALPIIRMMVSSILKGGHDQLIRIGGYTDDIPIHNESFDSNWDLSASRAISVLKVFEEEGYDPDLLQAVGFGSTHPQLPNRDENGAPIELNQSKNRRVVIRVLPDENPVPKVSTTPNAPKAGAEVKPE